ncbi:MAG: hypothetical protein LUM44_13095 [Pyrinomonadaceae bacterium]|nr:hypothetical protein [Pyrinomonadaceae bacterium]
MADRRTRQLSPKMLQADLDAFAGLESIDGYSPANSDFELERGRALKTSMQNKETKEVQSKAQYEADRDDKVEEQWRFHDWMRNAKQQIKSQFGENSNELATVGLKKKSEYKAPKRKNPTS